MGNGNYVYYPVSKEYYFGQDHYRLIYEKWIPSPQALAEFRLLKSDYYRAIIYTFRQEAYDNNHDDPYWCFYMTCLNHNRCKWRKHEYARYKDKGLSGVMSKHGVFQGQSTHYFNNFEIY
jgi:hypothetical protein